MLTQATLDAILTAAVAAGKVLDPAATFVRPITAGPVGDPALKASYTFPAAAAFAAQAVATWGATQHLIDGRACKAGPALNFVPASPADAATVIGFVYGDDSVTTNIKGNVLLPSPISLPDAFHPITIIPRVCMGENASFDASVVIDG